MQLSPTLECTQACLFCWRTLPSDEGYPITREREIPDDPREILDNAVLAQRRILNGYNPTCHPKVSPQMWEEARNPRNVAISLVGEPTLYERLSDLISECKHRNWTSYLVTNGTNPHIFEKIEEPTQLYVSLTAPDKSTHLKLCRPTTPNAWEKLNKSLNMLSTFSCPTVVRMTLIKEKNLHSIPSYAKLLNNSRPTFIECKSYMHVGSSMHRLARSNMPLMKDIQQFADELSKHTDYTIVKEDKVSRVVLLTLD
jgi:tRNA wybutosine-synthesizing protein 1